MRHEKITGFVNSCRSEIRMWLKHYGELFATFEELLEWRNRAIYGNELYAKVPRWAKAEIGAYWEVYFEDMLYNRRLFWTLVLDGKRYISGPHDAKLDGRLSEVDTNRSDRAYVCDVTDKDGLTYRMIVPFSAERREQDIKDGILSPENLTIAKNLSKQNVVRYHIGHLLNGSVRLAKETICE